MATLNLQTTSSILGKTATVNLSGTSVTSLLSNASSSGFVYKVRSIIVANSGAAAANITVAYYDAAALNGTAYPIVSTVSIPASSVLPILDSNTFIYMPDNSSIGVTAGTSNTLTVTCSYEQVTADSLPQPAQLSGGLWAFGASFPYGTLGINSIYNQSSPVQVGSLTNWAYVSVNTWHTLALKTDGTLWSWGNNNYGQLGANDQINKSSPVQIGALTNWSKISTSSMASFGIKTDGTLWSWGGNVSGELAQNNAINRSSPVQVGALTNWSFMSVGASAIKTDGTLWTWGSGYSGRIGDGTVINRSSPVQVGSGTSWFNVIESLGSRYVTLATKTDGTLWAWGNNYYATLGQNNKVNKSSPVQIGALTNWSKEANKIGVYTFCTVIKSDGSLWGWGRNNSGQLGTNDTVYRSSPVQVGGSTNWMFASAGKAIRTDGTLWSWGFNGTGYLGQNNTIYRSSPTQVGALSTWKFVRGYRSSFAIKE